MGRASSLWASKYAYLGGSGAGGSRVMGGGTGGEISIFNFFSRRPPHPPQQHAQHRYPQRQQRRKHQRIEKTIIPPTMQITIKGILRLISGVGVIVADGGPSPSEDIKLTCNIFSPYLILLIRMV